MNHVPFLDAHISDIYATLVDMLQEVFPHTIYLDWLSFSQGSYPYSLLDQNMLHYLPLHSPINSTENSDTILCV